MERRFLAYPRQRFKLRGAAPSGVAREYTRNELRDLIARVHVQAGGVLDVYLVSGAEAADLMTASFLGVGHATRLLGAVSTSIAHVLRSTGKRNPTLCVCCPRCVRRLDGIRIGIVAAATDDAADVISFVVCARCSSAPDLTKNIMHALRRIWPDLRPISITHPTGGRA